MPGAKGVIGARPGSHRVKAHTRRTKTGFTQVRQHTATNALRVSRKALTVRSPELKKQMAKNARNRSALIRAARQRALAGTY